MVYPKEPSCDDFATAPAAKVEVVEVDRCRHEYFQIPPLCLDHFLKTVLQASGPDSVSHLNDKTHDIEGKDTAYS